MTEQNGDPWIADPIWSVIVIMFVVGLLMLGVICLIAGCYNVLL